MRLITIEDCKPGNDVYGKNCGKIARMCCGISCSEMARYLGLQAKDVKDIEDGRATPERAIVEKMATLTNFPIGHFYRVPDMEDPYEKL